MNRIVPESGNKEIHLYTRTYYSLLRSTRAVQIRSLIEAHKRIHSALHVKAHTEAFDSDAFIYSILRVPECIDTVREVIIGQSKRVFAQHGFEDVEQWQRVSAPARRRRSFFDGTDTLAVYIASRSDIDDLIPILTAYQIERDKLHTMLEQSDVVELLVELLDDGGKLNADAPQLLAAWTDVCQSDWARLANVWQEKIVEKLLTIAQTGYELTIRSSAGSLVDYKRATRLWWQNIERHTPQIFSMDRPVYFISSNPHALPNVLSGFARLQEKRLKEFIKANSADDLRLEYRAIIKDNAPSSHENLLYYAQKKLESGSPDTIGERLLHERNSGIMRVPSAHAFDIEAVIVSLADIQPKHLDSRLRIEGVENLCESQAIIINIDYPLGMAAYQVLSEIVRNCNEIRGVYSTGKAATLNGRVGDVMIPNVVHDEHSLNTYIFGNCFSADDVAPYLVYGTVMDNQKAITVPGTFLQNEEYMSVFYEEGYTDMEMEAGPYLGCICEMVRPQRHPHNEIVNLHHTPFPIGLLHYASDTPFDKGSNLGAQSLSYFGMDATYATIIAILRAVFKTELDYLDSGS